MKIIQFNKNNESSYSLCQKQYQFDVEFSKLQVTVKLENSVLAKLELSKSGSLATSDFEITPSLYLEKGKANLVPINLHHWIITIPSLLLPSQWPVYEITKTQIGWDITLLNTQINTKSQYPASYKNTSSIARFSYEESTGKSGILEFTRDLSRKDTIFLSLAIAFAIQAQSIFPQPRNFFTLPRLTNSSPKSYHDKCRSLHLPRRKISLRTRRDNV